MMIFASLPCATSVPPLGVVGPKITNLEYEHEAGLFRVHIDLYSQNMLIRIGSEIHISDLF